MMKNIYLHPVLFLLAFAVFSHAPTQAKDQFGIVATVNEDAISNSDVEDRIRLVFARTGVRDSKENRAQAYPQALNSLIEEQLQIQEAERQNLDVTDEEIAEGYAGMAQQNSLTVEQFDQVIGQQGIPKSTLLKQIKAQIAWRNVVTKVLRPQVNVSENDVNARLERMRENIGGTEYRVAEIFLPVTETSQEKETQELARKLINEIKSKRVAFPAAAAQFSKSPSARVGGIMGWVQEGQLPKELDVVVKSLNINQISPPIQSLSGFYVLTVLEKREVTEETLPSQDDVLNAIGLERLNRLQERYLQDIRSTAFIDRRGA